MDKFTRDQERAQRAKAIYEDPLFVEAFDLLESALVDEFKESLANEHQRREDAHRSIRLLRHLRGHFVRAMASGEIARKKLLSVSEPSRLSRMINR